jgi:hypothetical protein
MRLMKILSTSALSAIAATNFLLLCNFSVSAQSFVYDVRETYSDSGFQYFDEDTGENVFGTSKGSFSSLFVMGPEEKVTVQTQTWDEETQTWEGETIEEEYSRHSYAQINVYTGKSEGTTYKEYYVSEYPVAEGDKFSGANPTFFQLDAAKKNVMLRVNGQSFDDFIGKAIFGKPISKASFTGSAASPIWYSSSLAGKSSGINHGSSDDSTSHQADEPYYGTSYSSQTSAKLNKKLTALVYTMDYSDALAAVIDDLESKGFVDGSQQSDE